MASISKNTGKIISNNYNVEEKIVRNDFDELDYYDVEREKVELIKTMRQVLLHNYEIERRLNNLINLLDDSKNRVNPLKTDDKNIV